MKPLTNQTKSKMGAVKSLNEWQNEGAVILHPNTAQYRFLLTVLENRADFIGKGGIAYQTGFRATFNGGRGCGKTNVLLRLVAESALELPKAKAGLASMTYLHVQNVVLSQCHKVFAEYGLYEYDAKTRPWGQYVVNKRPPEGWEKPWEAVNAYENTLTFRNGYTVVFLSADRPETARGLSLDQLFMDESFLLKETFYNTVLRKTVRANKYKYKDNRPGRKGYNHPLHWLIADFTSAAWTPEQAWIYRTEELMKKDPKRYYFMESTAYDNLHNLPGNFIESERESAESELAFEVEVLNRRPEKLENSYYGALSLRKHLYDKMYDYVWDATSHQYKHHRIDYNPTAALDTSWDFNARFTCMSIAQEERNELRFIDTLYVKKSDTTLVEKLATDFCTKYTNHLKKTVYLYGDSSGKKGDPGRKHNHFEMITNLLIKNGWTVINRVQDSYPSYRVRYQVINAILKEDNKSLPLIRINEQTCKSLVISLQHTPMIGDNFEKDKRSENNEKLDQQYATHFSDTFDYIIFKKYSRLVKLDGARSGGLRFRRAA
ncbi:MAG: terminase family protein [Spirosomataceae bacterium]